MSSTCAGILILPNQYFSTAPRDCCQRSRPAGKPRSFETNEQRVIHEVTRRTAKGHEAERLYRIDTAVARQADAGLLEQQDPLQEAPHPGARASRPHTSWHSLANLLHLSRAATALGQCGSGRRGGGLPHRRHTERLATAVHAGETPALPGGPHSVTASQQRTSIGIRVHLWFVFKFDRQFLPRMIRTEGRGRHSFETSKSCPLLTLHSSQRAQALPTTGWPPPLPPGRGRLPGSGRDPGCSPEPESPGTAGRRRR